MTPPPDPRQWQHEHHFALPNAASAEQRTRWVMALAVAMMVAEIIGGTLFHSMALVADGWHMSTHAGALGLAAFAYAYARRHAHDPRFAFGPGKVGTLAAFSSTVILALIALLIIAESFDHLAHPLAIQFSEALPIAVTGLLVNVVSAMILGGHGGHETPDDHHKPPHNHNHNHDHHDHSLRAAYVHIVADAVTSVLAIIALLLGKYLGWWWMDPLMGLVGAGVILNWAMGLARDTSGILLDHGPAAFLRQEVTDALAHDPACQLVDLHIWPLGAGHWAAIVAVVSHTPQEPNHYKALMQEIHELSHVTVEVHRANNPS